MALSYIVPQRKLPWRMWSLSLGPFIPFNSWLRSLQKASFNTLLLREQTDHPVNKEHQEDDWSCYKMGKDEMWRICSWWRKCTVKTLQDGTHSASRGLCTASCQSSNKAFDEITTTLVSVSPPKKRGCGQFNYHRTITISSYFIILKRCHSQKPFA